MDKKFVNITVSTSLSTDFFIEVDENATEEQIREQAIKEIKLPSDYPKEIESFLKNRMGITVQGLDSMYKNWNVDEVEYIIDN